MKYFRISGRAVDLANNSAYVRDWAIKKAASHAGNFVFNRDRQIEYLNDYLGRPPILVSPYDAELFGHWWFEGPEWLDYVIRKTYHDQDIYKLTTPGEYLDKYPRNQVVTPSYSSWGWKGYAEVWLEGSNDWTYRHLHKSADRMIDLAKNFPQADGVLKRALNQAAREVLLAQCSDWPFIMKTGTTVPYANKRFRDHIARFTRLYEEIRGNRINESYLSDVEYKDNIFPEVDYRVYST